jgi:hypothetical protein
VSIHGQVTGVPARRAVRLELRQSGTRPWQTLARATTTAGGRFTVNWHVLAAHPFGPIQLRIAAYKASRLLAASRPQSSAIGPAFVPCTPAQIPKLLLPIGYGLVSGGVYVEGGPYPGVDQCNSQPYRVTATNSAGTMTVGPDVAGGHGYWLSLPAGTYTFRASSCATAMTTVTAGQRTNVDLVCAVP